LDGGFNGVVACWFLGGFVEGHGGDVLEGLVEVHGRSKLRGKSVRVKWRCIV